MPSAPSGSSGKRPATARILRGRRACSTRRSRRCPPSTTRRGDARERPREPGDGGRMQRGRTVIGTTLGPYRLDRELGSGGMGAVYLATATDDAVGVRRGEQVAVKIVHSHLLERGGFFKRF